MYSFILTVSQSKYVSRGGGNRIVFQNVLISRNFEVPKMGNGHGP